MDIVNVLEPRRPRRALGVALVGVAVLLAGGALVAAGGARAQAAAPQVRVRLADLNPGTAAGARTLLARIKGAARQVCGETDTYDLDRYARVRQCRTEAAERAIREADIPALTALAARSAPPLRLAGS